MFDNIAGFIDPLNLRMPQLSSDFSIGESLRNRSSGARFSGDIRTDKSLSGNITGGPGEIILHEKGLKICNKYYEDELEINRSQIVKFIKFQTVERISVQPPAIPELILIVLVILTLGIILAFGIFGTSESRRRDSLKYVSWLGIQYWDPDSNSAKRILISGKDKRIDKFISRCNRLNISYT